MSHGKVRATWVAATTLVAISGAAADEVAELPIYAWKDLGDLPGGYDNSVPTAINSHGAVAGYSSAATGFHAFLFDSDLMTDLGEFPSGADYSVAWGMNDSSAVVGMSKTSSRDLGFVWVSGVMSSLGWPPFGYDSVARDINNAGQVVGYTNSGSQAGHAFLRQGNNWIDLGDLPGGYDQSGATAINENGEVAGYGATATGYHAVFWDSFGGIHDIGELPGGYESAFASGINDLGTVVGWSLGSEGQAAFIWDATRGMRSLGDLAGGDNYSLARGINNVGTVVGYGITNDGQRGFVWDEASGIRDLNVIVGDLQSWIIFEAMAINNVGQIAAVASDGPSRAHAVLLTPISHLLTSLEIAAGGVEPDKRLLKQVSLAGTYYDANDLQATCSQLTDLNSQVQKLPSKKTSQAQKDDLLGQSTAIMDALGCP